MKILHLTGNILSFKDWCIDNDKTIINYDAASEYMEVSEKDKTEYPPINAVVHTFSNSADFIKWLKDEEFCFDCDDLSYSDIVAID